ncbi:type III secretion system ATPase SctN [uncultured Endozoicomonas sp.]|uniref:type III secretion system ATPase SctN n=1 Tax=uncultured Endozoicomonas sp. TaxID=432652 RepID=UPI00262070A2|nr:type III secretion system ATPase SctN [uncultured Endozoicomonas sp.]
MAQAFNYLTNALQGTVESSRLVDIRGRVTEVQGMIIKAAVPGVKIGELCQLVSPNDPSDKQSFAEVVGFQGHETVLSPLGEIMGISSTTEVLPTGKVHHVAVGPHLLGHVLDGMGSPLQPDAFEGIEPEAHYPVYADAPDPLTRQIIDHQIPLGVRAIDGLLSCGEGQRMGIFAAAGGGKSTLLSMLVKGAEVDVTVLALIGERGRELREFIEHDLGPEGVKKSVIIVATSDKSSMERTKAAYTATAVAEYFRDKGQRVLLLMDSVTRFARAQREIGLAAGEPPTRRGFPPSVFATLPKLMERTGMSDVGSITALYTVLVEGDDMTEPVADETRSILDGHIIMSRKLASAGHYPAIDVLASASRVMTAITDQEHQAAAIRMRELMSKYEEIELLVKVGEYKPGTDPTADEAIQKIETIRTYLKQKTDELTTVDEAIQHLRHIVGR